MLTAWASVFSAWGVWDLTGEAGGEALIAWVSAPAWGACDLTGEAGGEALIAQVSVPVLVAWASACSPEELFAWGLPTGGTALNQVIFHCFLISLLNLLTCLSLILMNLSLLTLSINSWHFLIVEFNTKDASFDLLCSICLALSPRILLMDFTCA